MDYQEKARRVIQLEIDELSRLHDRLDESFGQAVEALRSTLDQQGKIIIVDRDSGGRGHINADDFRFSGQKVADIKTDVAHESGTHESGASVPGTPAPDAAPTTPAPVPGEHPAAGAGVQPSASGVDDGARYEQWFPAPPRGWTAGKAEIFDTRQMLQVKKDYTNSAQRAKLTIHVIANRFVPLKNADQNEKRDNDSLKKLAAISDTVTTMEHQGHMGLLTEEGDVSDLTFKIGGEALLIDLNATPENRALLLNMARHIDLEQAVRLFLKDNREAASRKTN